MGADGSNERCDLGGVLDARRRLDAAGDVHRPRLDCLDGGADVVRA